MNLLELNIDYSPIINKEVVDNTFEFLHNQIKVKSPDKIAKVACAIIDGDELVSYGYNHVPEEFKNIETVWDKHDLDIGNGFFLNKRDIVIHAERDAMSKIAPLTSLKRKHSTLCLLTAFPCSQCLVALLSFGIRTIIYERDTSINNVETKEAKSFFMAKNYNSADYPVVIINRSSLPYL